jgi:glycosyltransferase involved in cell wall biosynthesis
MAAGFYDIGGASTVMEQLANRLAEKGHKVTIGALWFTRFPSEGAFNVVRIPVGNVLKLRRFLEGFDVVHSHHAITNYLALVTRKPFIYHYHGAPNFGRGYLFRLSMISSIKLMKHAFNAIIAVSESGAAELKHYFGLDGIHVIYNGVDTRLFKLGLEEKFRKGEPQFLFVGNLYEHKKVDELILAMKELVKAYPKAYLQIVGYGQRFDFLKRFITKLGLEENVELVGRVSRYELPYYYSSCDVYVTASRYEVCPVPLLEAMASGKPVVASSIPPHVELLTNSKVGLISAEGDLEALCKNMTKAYEESESYRHNAVSFAKEHNWSSIASDVLRVYNQITDNNQSI